jgi:PKD repeat protein
LDELKLSAQHADTAYNYMLTAPQPVVAEGNACYGSSTVLNATGAGSFNWYTDFTGGQPFHSGSSFNTGNLLNDTTFYVSNADNFYESVRTPAIVNIKAKPSISTSGSTTICSNETVILGAEEADTYLWSNGATTQTIEVSAAGDYSVTVSSISPVCQNTSSPVTVSLITAPVAAFTQTGDLKSFSPIQFTDQSTGAISWEWDFGDGQTSSLQNPTVTYNTGDAYEVTLFIQDVNGCQDTIIQSIAVITGLGDTPDGSLRVSPNPARGMIQVELLDGTPGPRSIELITLQGRVVYRQADVTASRVDIPLNDLSDGIYIVRVASGSRVLNRKVVKIH